MYKFRIRLRWQDLSKGVASEVQDTRAYLWCLAERNRAKVDNTALLLGGEPAKVDTAPSNVALELGDKICRGSVYLLLLQVAELA